MTTYNARNTSRTLVTTTNQRVGEFKNCKAKRMLYLYELASGIDSILSVEH